MTQRIGNITVIHEEPASKCELCGVIEETRPYGPNGERICYDYGLKDPITTEIKMHKFIFGDDVSVEKAKEYLIRSGRSIHGVQ